MWGEATRERQWEGDALPWARVFSRGLLCSLLKMERVLRGDMSCGFACVFFFFFAIRFKLGPVRHCVQTWLDPTPNHPTCLQKVSLATSRPLIISWSELQWGRDKASDEVAWLTCFAWVDLNHTIKLIHARKNKYGRLSRASQVTSC